LIIQIHIRESLLYTCSCKQIHSSDVIFANKVVVHVSHGMTHCAIDMPAYLIFPPIFYGLFSAFSIIWYFIFLTNHLVLYIFQNRILCQTSQ